MLKKIAYYFNSFMTFSILGVFGIVAGLLHLGGKLLHLTYNEVNILAYYLLIPLLWCILIDYNVIKFPILTILLILLWTYIFITKRKFFSKWCDIVFDLSVIFLLKFQKIGWNYYKSSVIICVIVPIIITILLLLI